jgi:hypothetical protein
MKSMTQDKARLLERVAQRIVPEVAELDTHGLTRFFSIIDDTLRQRPAPVRRQLAGFLGLIRWLPVIRYGKPFEGLRPERQDAILRWLQECPIGLLQKGFWGLKTIIYLGFYGRQEVWEVIGYNPVRDGNTRLHA